jgi:serine/threonine protein kinase
MYEKGKKLGSGMTGDVFLVTHKITNQQFALKSMERRKINPDLIEDLRNEIAILKVVRWCS